jgi:hypothetical protein
VATKFRKHTDLEYDAAFYEAFRGARQACSDYLKNNPGNWFPCGFAWVVFDGRDPAVKFLKKSKGIFGRLAGDAGYPKGWHIWDPADSGTQCMEAKLAGARRFVEVLKGAGIECFADSRMD